MAAQQLGIWSSVLDRGGVVFYSVASRVTLETVQWVTGYLCWGVRGLERPGSAYMHSIEW